MDIQIITAPLIGGLIGLLTNGIAIKMMFRPLKPVYIGKFRVPLTPGIILAIPIKIPLMMSKINFINFLSS